MSECDHLILKKGTTADFTPSTRGKNI